MNKTILDFFNNQTCATICCINSNVQPYCFSCFYVFNASEGLLYFKSSVNTDHARFLALNPVVSGTVLPDRLNKLVVKGIQFTGVVLKAEDPLAITAGKDYYKRIPMAMAMKGNVFTIKISSVKMTDSSQIFGSKIIWERDHQACETV